MNNFKAINSKCQSRKVNKDDRAPASHFVGTEDTPAGLSDLNPVMKVQVHICPVQCEYQVNNK